MFPENDDVLISASTGEECQIVRSYIISREVDSLSSAMEAEMEALQKKYDFDMDIENYPAMKL